jgi:nucleolar protein 56
LNKIKKEGRKMDSRTELRKKLLAKTREKINEKLAGREIHIIKAVNLLSDLDSIENLLKENASEWKARAPTGKALTEYTELEENAKKIETEKAKLSEFVISEMTLEFPNFSEIATPIIGAKLLSSAGSKRRLCFMPASTVQVLGAEKALFAHMKQNAKSPKHGHLFNHPMLQKLSRGKRGKAARVIAGKLAIALKQDYFKGENTAKEVIKELEIHIAKIAAEPEKEKARPGKDERRHTSFSDYQQNRNRPMQREGFGDRRGASRDNRNRRNDKPKFRIESTPTFQKRK